MDTNILTPKALFLKDIRYTVPAFQRRYVWTHEDQWEPLWEDVRNTADDYLEKFIDSGGDRVKAEQNTGRHFLGAVVVQQVSTATKDIERREIIDGQQRLTTLQLLLDAVQFVCEKHKVKGVATRLAKLVTNDKDLVSDDDELFKLWPTTNDREAFRHAMHNALSTDQLDESLIVKAHAFFQLQSCQWLELEPLEIDARAEALETALTGMLQMVVIDLDPPDDPNVIFETLNARGTPLLHSDLIKNYVTYKIENNGGDTVWGSLDDDWWRKEIKQGRLIRSRIDAFLDYWLEMKTENEVSASEVFNVFKRVAENSQVRDVVSELKDNLLTYRRFETGERTSDEELFHYRMNVMEIGAFTPALLAILNRSQQEQSMAFRVIESFLVRRMLCRDTTKDYNRMALELVRDLRDNGVENAGEVAARYLSNQSAPSRKWPTDTDVKDAVSNLQLFRLLTRGRLRLILEAIEATYRDAALSEQPDVPKRLSIEHIMPQSWEEHWPLLDEGEGE